MKAINITPDTIKLLEGIVAKKSKGYNAAEYALEKLFNPEKAMVYKETDTNVFWIESHDAPKYAIAFVKTRLKNDKGLVDRDAWKEEKKKNNPVVKVVKVVKEAITPKKEEEKDLNLANITDLKLFINKYMKGYKMSSKFAVKKLTPELTSEFFKEVGNNYTEGISSMINKIYGGKKPNYRNKNKMSSTELAEFNQNTRDEFDWFFENLVWLAKPSKKYIQEHKKFNTHNYQVIAADLSSCVQNSLYQHRTSGVF